MSQIWFNPLIFAQNQNYSVKSDALKMKHKSEGKINKNNSETDKINGFRLICYTYSTTGTANFKSLKGKTYVYRSSGA